MVHHALVNVLEPIYERTFSADSYACRKGKGTHAAVKRAQDFARRYRLADAVHHARHEAQVVNRRQPIHDQLARAKQMIPKLKEFGVEFLEQPLVPEDLDGLVEVRRVAAKHQIPIVVDESCLVAADIPRLAGRVDGINIKLAKCGSLREALRMIATARAHGMLVMVGCMIETSLGITAAAHFTPLVDAADLDGAALTVDDPFSGATIDQGQIRLPTGPGLGVSRR